MSLARAALGLLLAVSAAAQTDERSISGQVVTADGKPAAGARVWVRSLTLPDGTPAETGLALGADGPLATTADAAGTFRIIGIRAGTAVQLAVAWPGGEPFLLYARYRPGQEGIRIVAKPPGMVLGRVTYRARPVAGVRLFATPGDELSEQGYPEAVTDADGMFVLTALRTGVYTILVQAKDGRGAKPVENLAVRPGDRLDGIAIELIEGNLVRGYVLVSGTGERVEGATIRFLSGRGRVPICEVTTGKHGIYGVRLAPGGYMAEYVGNPAFPAEWAHTRESSFGVADNQDRPERGPAFHLRPAIRLTGRAVGPDGQPTSGVEIGSEANAWPTPQPGEFFRWRTDAAGRFVLDLRETGPWQAPWIISARDTQRGLAAVAGTTDSTAPLEIRLSQAATAECDVADTRGKPVPDVEFWVAADCPEGRSPWMLVGKSDAAGRARLACLPAGVPLWISPGRESLWMAVGPSWSDPRAVTLTSGHRLELPKLVLNTDGRTVRGRVLDPQGQPVKDAVVGLEHAERVVETDGNGAFETTTPLAAGKVWVVTAHPKDALFVAQELDPDAGTPVDLELLPAGSVEGQVVDREGKPIEEADVRFWIMPALRYQTPTDPRLDKALLGVSASVGEGGKWRADGLIAGAEYSFGVYPPLVDRSPEFPVVVPRAGQTVDLGRLVLED